MLLLSEFPCRNPHQVCDENIDSQDSIKSQGAPAESQVRNDRPLLSPLQMGKLRLQKIK